MEERYCEGCGKKLPENARKGKRHCNSTCRVQAFFKRKFQLPRELPNIQERLIDLQDELNDIIEEMEKAAKIMKGK